MKAFVRLTAWDDTDLFVRVDRIESVYYDEEVDDTAVMMMNRGDIHHVKETPADVMVYIRSALAVVA